MKWSWRDAAYLRDMLDAARQAAAFGEGFDRDDLVDDVRTRYATERALSIVGGASARLSRPGRQIPMCKGPAADLAKRYLAIGGLSRDEQPGLGSLATLVTSIARRQAAGRSLLFACDQAV